MANTALGAKSEKITRTITFKNKEHEKFYIEYLPKCRYQDAYHKALVYCLGIDEDTRKCVNRIYDFKTGCVKTESLQEGWITSGSAKIVRIAYFFMGVIQYISIQFFFGIKKTLFRKRLFECFFSVLGYVTREK